MREQALPQADGVGVLRYFLSSVSVQETVPELPLN
ncbi:hypothetical protein EMIT0357P_20018 [Pseudomonas marginalis]